MPDDWLKTKVYVPGHKTFILTQPIKNRSRRAWESETSSACDFPLHLQDTIRIDAYDGDGESQLLSVEYTLTDEGLVLKDEINGGLGVQVVIEQ